MTGKINSFKDLKIWQKGKELVKNIYTLTNKFPKEELYGLTSQLRRAAISVPANVAEGCARNHRKEYIQFLGISLGSLAELDTELEIAYEIGYIKDKDLFKGTLQMIQEERAMILSLKSKLC